VGLGVDTGGWEIGSETVFTFGGGEWCAGEGGGALIPIPGPTIPVAKQVAVVATPAVQTAAIFWALPASAPALPPSLG
jgi:hypothetical protein